jgi:hypothetical protein
VLLGLDREARPAPSDPSTPQVYLGLGDFGSSYARCWIKIRSVAAPVCLDFREHYIPEAQFPRTDKSGNSVYENTLYRQFVNRGTPLPSSRDAAGFAECHYWLGKGDLMSKEQFMDPREEGPIFTPAPHHRSASDVEPLGRVHAMSRGEV